MTPSATPTYVIAEAGVNHNGDLDTARQLVDVAAKAGADAVKFQTFNAKALASENAPSAAYQKTTMGDDVSQFEMLRKLELSRDSHFRLKDQCEGLYIDFLSSPFDLESLDFLVSNMDMKTIKIPSGELTNGPLIHAAAKADVTLIMSTGMSTLDEIDQALALVVFATTHPDDSPSLEKLDQIRQETPTYDALKNKISLLHCTSDYPAPINDVNLTAIPTMADRFSLKVGYSDHSEGIVVAVAAVALGAHIIEKHFTLDRDWPGPDHKASLDPAQLGNMINDIRLIEKARGDGVKVVRPSERGTMEVARKGLVANRPICQGDIFTEQNLSALRPGNGLSPMLFWDMIGQSASRDYAAGERIEI